MIHRLRPLLLPFALCADVFLMAVYKLGDYDIWYHLAVGRQILATGKIVQLEPFAYTASQTPWSLLMWLGGVVFYVVHAVGGVGALILFNAAVIAAAFALVYLTMMLDGTPDDEFPLAATLLIVAAFTARFRFMVRPHVFEFLFLAAVLYLLNLHRARGTNRLWLLPLIQVLWVNIHGSHILGIMVPLVFLVGSQVRRFIPGVRGQGRGSTAGAGAGTSGGRCRQRRGDHG